LQSSWYYNIHFSPSGELFAEVRFPGRTLRPSFVIPVLLASSVWLTSASWALTTFCCSVVVCLAGLFQLGFDDLMGYRRRLFGWPLTAGLGQLPGIQWYLFAAICCFAVAAL
jgi:hypothetical protein